MNNYPPYACKCCGYANADMFCEHYNFEPTETQIMEFRAYRKVWDMLRQESNQAREVAVKRMYFHRMENNRNHKEPKQ